MEKQGGAHDAAATHIYTENGGDEDLRRGPWTAEEDFALINYITHHGHGRWTALASSAGLKRTGKSCRLRWLNYLRPSVRRGNITLEEQLLILELHSRWGNRWSKIAEQLPGRTDNEIKNYWRTRVQKHAKQLKCDVNSKQFKDAMRYFWMPRLLEKIRDATANPSSAGHSSSATAISYQFNNNNLCGFGDQNIMVPAQPNTSVGDSTPASDLTESCNNNPIHHGNSNNNHNYNIEDYYQAASQMVGSGDCYEWPLRSPAGYFDPGIVDENNQWMEGGDVSESFWVEDTWFQFNGGV